MQRSGIMCVGAMRKSKFTRRMNRHLPLSSKRGNKHYNKGRGVKSEGRVTVRRRFFSAFSSIEKRNEYRSHIYIYIYSQHTSILSFKEYHSLTHSLTHSLSHFLSDTNPNDATEQR